MLGVSAGLPAARCRSRQRHFSAMPASMAASLEPVVEVPVASSSSGELHSRLSMLTQRCSSSAVRGYSSLSIMFLSNVSVMSRSACGSIHVVTKVARLRRALPSSISSSRTNRYAVRAHLQVRDDVARRTSRLAGTGVDRTQDQRPQILDKLAVQSQGPSSSPYAVPAGPECRLPARAVASCASSMRRSESLRPHRPDGVKPRARHSTDEIHPGWTMPGTDRTGLIGGQRGSVLPAATPRLGKLRDGWKLYRAHGEQAAHRLVVEHVDGLVGPVRRLHGLRGRAGDLALVDPPADEHLEPALAGLGRRRGSQPYFGSAASTGHDAVRVVYCRTCAVRSASDQDMSER